MCKVCFDGIADSADIVFGDAWKCENGNYPSFEETDGRNLIICRTETGKKLMNETKKNGYLELSCEDICDEQFKIIQPSQSNRRYYAKYKIIGLRIMGFKYPIINTQYLNRVYKMSEIRLSILQKIRSICGSIRRAKLAKEKSV